MSISGRGWNLGAEGDHLRWGLQCQAEELGQPGRQGSPVVRTVHVRKVLVKVQLRSRPMYQRQAVWPPGSPAQARWRSQVS